MRFASIERQALGTDLRAAARPSGCPGQGQQIHGRAHVAHHLSQTRPTRVALVEACGFVQTRAKAELVEGQHGHALLRQELLDPRSHHVRPAVTQVVAVRVQPDDHGQRPLRALGVIQVAGHVLAEVHRHAADLVILLATAEHLGHVGSRAAVGAARRGSDAAALRPVPRRSAGARRRSAEEEQVASGVARRPSRSGGSALREVPFATGQRRNRTNRDNPRSPGHRSRARPDAMRCAATSGRPTKRYTSRAARYDCSAEKVWSQPSL